MRKALHSRSSGFAISLVIGGFSVVALGSAFLASTTTNRSGRAQVVRASTEISSQLQVLRALLVRCASQFDPGRTIVGVSNGAVLATDMGFPVGLNMPLGQVVCPATGALLVTGSNLVLASPPIGTTGWLYSKGATVSLSISVNASSPQALAAKNAICRIVGGFSASEASPAPDCTDVGQGQGTLTIQLTGTSATAGAGGLS